MSATADIKEQSKLTKEEWREYTKTVWQIANESHAVHPAVFPAEIPHRLIKLFTFWGDTVLDPFAGVGTTAKAGIPIGRKVVCVEQNATYVDLIRSECGELTNGKSGPAPLQVVQGDSRRLDFLADNSVGLVVTSPPYWNKADYGKTAENLGNVGNYRRFFQEIKPVFEECYRVLQPGRKLCIVTAQRQPAHQSRAADVSARDGLHDPLAGPRVRPGERNHLEQRRHRRKVGLVRRTATDLRQLPLPAELPLQERPRVHPDLRQAGGEGDEGAESAELRTPDVAEWTRGIEWCGRAGPDKARLTFAQNSVR